MVTNAVNMDLKVNSPNGAKQREGDSGFSDVLGSVSDNRRQQGLTNSSRKEFGKEIGFAQRASESVHEPTDSAPVSDAAAYAPRREQSFDEAVADKYLEQAVETVVYEVVENGEVPTKKQAAGMMADALKELTPETKEAAADIAAQAPETDIPQNVQTAATAIPVPVTAAVKQDDPADTSEAAVTAQIPEAEVLNALVGVMTAMTGESGEVQVQTDMPAAQPDEQKVQVITPDTAFLMTEKHSEVAMIAENTTFTPQPTEIPEGDEFMAELDAVMRGDYNKEAVELEQFGLTFAEKARGATAAVAETGNDVFIDRVGLIDRVLARLETVTTDDGEPITELEVVKDTAELLGKIITEAKQELGLTEVKYELRPEAEIETQMPQLMPDTPVKLSRDMNSSDRTGELDHILNEGRSDAPEKGTTKTDTYDAVHMSAELMRDRAHAEVNVERSELPEAENNYRPPEIQTAEQILARIRTMQDDHAQFTMVLNPESLGRITVKLVMVGERTAVEITAENPETRAILAARSESLQSALRQNGVELERYQVVTEQEDAQYHRDDYEGGGRNRQGHEQEQNAEKHDDGDDNDDGNGFYDLLGEL